MATKYNPEELQEQIKERGNDLNDYRVMYDENGDPCEAWTKRDVDMMVEQLTHGIRVHTSPRWHTPQEYIDACRELMGDIDIDPASNEQAQKRIRAKIYHIDTPERDAFQFEWYGRLFMCPPYDEGLIGRFTDRVVEQYQKGNVTEAVVLAHTSCTQSGWFYTIASSCHAFCFIQGRVKWVKGHKADEMFKARIGMDWRPVYSNHGSCFFYLGKNAEKFCNIFSKFGQVMVPYGK